MHKIDLYKIYMLLLLKPTMLFKSKSKKKPDSFIT